MSLLFPGESAIPLNAHRVGTASPPYITADLIGTGLIVEKRGYLFTYAQTGSGFTLNADPVTAGVTGTRHFFVNEQLTIHMDPSNPADINDPVIL